MAPMTGGMSVMSGMGQDFPGYGSGGGGGDGSLSDVIASAVMDLDATISASYSGSGQTWANLCTAPADGAAQTDYDVYRGASSSATTDDPTFNGSAGDPAAYWSVDGGDFFDLIGSNTTFLNNLHKTTGGQDFWAAICLRFGSITNNQSLWATQDQNAGIGVRGQKLSNAASNRPYHLQNGGSASDATATSFAMNSTSTDYCFIVSHSHSGNNTRIWLNNTTAQSISHTYNTTTASASRKLRIGGNGSTNLNSGGRIYAYSMGNAYLDNTGAADIFSEYNTRHSRTYA